MRPPEGTDAVVYDALNRVKQVTRTSPTQPASTETYDYNALGALKLNAGVALDDQRPKRSGGGTADAGVPASYGGQPVVLDLNGRITSFQGMTFLWNTNTNLLRSATVGSATETYRQDFFGRAAIREPAAPPLDHYIYDDVDGVNVVGVRRWVGLTNSLGNRVLQKLDNYLYDGVDHPLRLQHRLQVDATTFQTVYFEVDLTGNVRRLRGPAGDDLGGYRYTAFGKAYQADATTPGAQVDQPLRWKGRWFNALTGLYDMRARQWSPELAGFLQADEFEFLGTRDMSRTLWSWPGQNPLRYRDPSGRDFEDWFLRNGNYAAAGVAAVALAPLALVGGLEIAGAAGAAESAFAATTTSSILEATSLGGQELVVAAGRSAAELPFTSAEGAALRALFGQGAEGALGQLGNLTELPPGITADLLLRYAVLARAIIEAGKDTVGAQDARLQLIDEALKVCK